MATKKRLIDANELLRIYKKWIPQLILPQDQKDKEAIETCIKVLEDQPTVDAAPVVHAHWKEWWPPKHMIMTGEEMLYVCSACTAKYSDIENKRYCPWCGAIMDEEKEDTFEQDYL